MAAKITAANFENEVMKAGKPVVVDFWASWCGPCRMLAPVIDQLSDEYSGKALVGKVNVDEEADLAAKYGIVSIPTVIIFVNGKECERLVGVRGKDDYEEAVEKYL